MRVRAAVLFLVAGCAPLATAGLGTDAFGPPEHHVGVSAGIVQNFEDEAAVRPEYVGAAVDVATGRRGSVGLAFAIAPTADPSTMTRVTARHRLTTDSNRGLALLGGATLTSWIIRVDTDGDGVHEVKPTFGYGGFVGPVGSMQIPGAPVLVSLGSTLGVSVADNNPFIQVQVVARTSFLLAHGLSLDAEVGAVIQLSDGPDVLPGLLVSITGNVPTRRQRAR